jgi:hypothetical protein
MGMARNKSLRVPCDVPAVRLDVRLLSTVAKQAPFRGTLTEFGESCCLASFALAQLFYAGLLGFTTEHPPQDIVRGGRCVLCVGPAHES